MCRVFRFEEYFSAMSWVTGILRIQVWHTEETVVNLFNRGEALPTSKGEIGGVHRLRHFPHSLILLHQENQAESCL